MGRMFRSFRSVSEAEIFTTLFVVFILAPQASLLSLRAGVIDTLNSMNHDIIEIIGGEKPIVMLYEETFSPFNLRSVIRIAAQGRHLRRYWGYL